MLDIIPVRVHITVRDPSKSSKEGWLLLILARDPYPGGYILRSNIYTAVLVDTLLVGTY